MDRKIQLRDGEILEDVRVPKEVSRKVQGVKVQGGTLKKEPDIAAKKEPGSAPKKTKGITAQEGQGIPAKKAPKKKK